MKSQLLSFFILFITACSNTTSKSNAFVPESSGNLNHVTVVMPERDWNGALGATVRDNLEQVYEGLPIDEPQYTLMYMPPKAFLDLQDKAETFFGLETIQSLNFNLLKINMRAHRFWP